MDEQDKIITEEEKKKLTEEVVTPILKESEKRMTEGIRTQKPVEPITRQEQFEEFSERKSEQKDKLLKQKAELVERKTKLESDFSQAGIAVKENIQSEIEKLDKAIIGVEKEVPLRPRPGAPTSEKIALPTTLPKHGVRALYSEGERILERAARITNLPPESPFTHSIAQRIAKGDPFSTEAMEDAQRETMKLVRAGFIPNPNYEGWAGKVVQAYETIAPLTVEIGLPMTQAIVTSPMLVAPAPGTRVAYFAGLGLNSGVANMWAQQMRIGYGHQDETSYQEAAAATAWGLVPTLGPTRKMSAAATTIIRGFEGAVMGSGENLTHQGLEILYGKREEISGTQLALTTAGGATIGSVLGRLESALIKYEPKEKAAPILRKAIKDELRGAKKELARVKKAGQVRGLKTHEAKIAKLEKKLEELREPEDKILQRAIDQLEEQEQQQVESFELFAKEWQESKAAQAIKESDVQAKEQEGISRAFLDYDESTNPEWLGSMANPNYKNVYNPETQSWAYMNKAGEIIDLKADTPIQINKSLEELGDDDLEELLRVKRNEQEDLENWEDDSLIPEGQIEKIIDVRTEVETIELEDWRRNVEWRALDLVKDPEAINDPFNDLFGKVFDEVRLDTDISDVKVAMAFEAIKQHGLEDQFKNFLKGRLQSLGTQVEAEDAEFLFRTEMEKATNAYKKFLSKPAIEEPTAKIEEAKPVVTEKPEGEVKQQAREALDDFMAGGGTRDVDPETGKLRDTDDEIKARLLTDEGEKQRLVNAVQDAIKEDLQNVKGGREGQLEYLSKVQRELDRRLGTDAGDEFSIVLSASQLSDNLEVADALNELSIQMTANGAVMVKGFDDVLKLTREKNFDSPEELNDAMVSIHKLIPQMLGWKKTGTAAGRLLQSRKYTKDQLEVKIEQLEAEMEENLVSSLKASKDMTPEQLDKQIQTFGDIEAVKRLLKAVQQADDVSEVKDILIKQQQAFQNKSTLKKNFDQGANLYTKVRDVGQDLLYSSMLSSPTTLIKVGIGNAVMSRYNSWMGKVGAKYMAVAPWARRGMSKEQFDEAYNFWSRVASSYGEFNDIALQEAKKAFKSGISDLRSHFERIGESALSMERTGLSGALGQSLENLGQFVDVPGKAMAMIDARSRMRIAHAMTKSKAAYDWRMSKLKGEEVPENFDEYYNGFLNKVFTEDGTRLMTEDQVRRQAILNAEKEGVRAEDLASYIDSYVQNNWDKSTSNFVDYVQRNVKEITFTDELGEFADMNTLEVPVKSLENILNTFPLLKTILNPFQRTGRNIIREGLSTTSALADVPGIKKFSDKIWSKTVQDLNSNDPIIAARAKGRQIVGAGIIATAWGMAEAGLYEGMISQNWKKRENIQTATGLNDYELRLPVGDGKYIGQDIAALEPFATVMNIVADCHTLSKGSMAQKREAMSALNILALVVSNNIGNKSYFKNLGDALQLITVTSESEEAVEAKRMRLLKGMLGAGVPSAMNAMSMATDEFRRRSDDMLKMLAKRIGGIAKEVPVHRDMWGEPQQLHKTDKAQAVSLINPFKLGKQLMDVEDYVVQSKDGLRSFDKEKFKSINLKNKEEVRNAAWAVALELDGEYHFNGGTSIKDGIDLQEIIHPETRIDAFERWQEIYKNQKIDGLTAQQATVVLARQLTTPTKLDPNQTPEGFKQEDKRLEKLRKVLNGYKKVAYEKMRQEYPVLLAQEKESKIRNALLTISPNAEQLKRITSGMPVEEYKKTQPDTRLQELLKKTPYGPAAKLLEVSD